MPSDLKSEVSATPLRHTRSNHTAGSQTNNMKAAQIIINHVKQEGKACTSSN